MLIGLVTLWAIYVVVACLFVLSIIFAFVQEEPKEVPLGRLQAIRQEVISTFVFYGILHLLQGSVEVFQ